MERVILHSDCNNFYASVECLYNPKIREFPVVVGGDPEARHGIVLAKNNIAKGYGVKTGEALWEAKQKCPNLISVPANYSLYLRFSKMVRDIYAEYSDQIESFGIDENWIDVTGSATLFGTGEKIADEIRRKVKDQLGITVSVGVSYNKIFAKLGSDMKKPDATTIITKDNYKNKVWSLPVSELLYVGRSTNKRLYTLGVTTIGELANFHEKYLYRILGKWGLVLKQFANGGDMSSVAKNGNESIVKSIGNSITTPKDLTNSQDVRLTLSALSESVAARLREQGLKCTTIQIYVRDYELNSCERQEKLTFPTFISSEISAKAYKIFKTKYEWKKPIRSIGVRACDLIPENSNIQLSLFVDNDRREKLEKLEHVVDSIRNRYGNFAIQKADMLLDKCLTKIDPKSDHTIHPTSFFV